MKDYKKNKRIFLLIIFLLVAAFVFLLVFLIVKEEKKEQKEQEDESPVEETFDWLYGKYVNELDSNSYIEITKEKYVYKKNVCEGYYTYDSNEYTFTKEINKEDDEYSVEIRLEVGSFVYTFTGVYKEKEFNTIEGIYTCSGSKIYVKQK